MSLSDEAKAVLQKVKDSLVELEGHLLSAAAPVAQAMEQVIEGAAVQVEDALAAKAENAVKAAAEQVVAKAVGV